MVTIVISTDYHGDRKLIHRVFRCIGSTFFPAKIDFLSQIRSCRQFIELVSRTLHASCTFVRRENWKKQIAPAFGGDFVDGLRFKILVGLRSCSAAWFDIYIYIYIYIHSKSRESASIGTSILWGIRGAEVDHP